VLLAAAVDMPESCGEQAIGTAFGCCVKHAGELYGLQSWNATAWCLAACGELLRQAYLGWKSRRVLCA